MAQILDARVQQKKDTLPNWIANELVPLSGEQCFVVDDDGGGINFKIGDGVRLFRDLPWFNIVITGDSMVVVNTIAEFRLLPQSILDRLESGQLKGVTVLGYYTKGDTPLPIDYYLSDTTSLDDGGSVIEVGSVKLEHKFDNSVDVKYYGYFGDKIHKSQLEKCIQNNNSVIISESADIGNGLNITKNNLDLIGVNSELLITEQTNYALRINGDNNRLLSIKLDGDNKTVRGFSMNGINNEVLSCNVSNCYGSATLGASAIEFVNNDTNIVQNCKALNNRVENISAPNIGEIGAGEGSARGIVVVGYNSDRFKPNHIDNNYVYNITGREGDGIHVISVNGSTLSFDNSYTFVSNNNVENCNRRLIKIQSSNCEVYNNSFSNTFSNAEMVGANGGIGIINSNNTLVYNNIGDVTKFPYGISVSNETTSLGVGNVIEGNNLKSDKNTASSWDNPINQRALYIVNQQAIKVSNNIFLDGRFEFVNTKASTISDNTILNTTTTNLNQGIQLDANCIGNTISGNKGDSNTGVIVYFISVAGKENIIRNNSNNFDKSLNYSIVQLTATASDNVISNNHNNSDVFNGLTNSSTLNNFIQLNNSGFGTLRNITIRDSVPTSGKYKIGDIIYQTPNNTTVKNIGWACVGNSVSNNGGTWIPFGVMGNYSGTVAPNGSQSGVYGNLYFRTGASANARDLLYLKTVDSGNLGWEKIVTQNFTATSTENGVVKQSTNVTDVTTANATDLTTAIALVNELKTKLNAKLTADRISGQQAST